MNIRKKTKKRQLTYEQKLFAVNEVRLKKRNRQDVADEMEIHINSLTGWLKLYREHGEDALHSHYEKSDLIEHTEELNRLRDIEKKYKEQLIQNEILKKFQAFLKENEKRSASKP
ncbi:transposase [Psychrobacillus glaciei]|nr:transposase [Psychrobacillus glaciei]